MPKAALKKKYNDTPKRKEMRDILGRWAGVENFCKSTNEEIAWFQRRAGEVAELRARADIKVSGGRTSDPTAKTAEDLEKLQKDYERTVERGTADVNAEIRFKQAMDEILRENMTSEDMELIRMRFKRGWSWIMVSSKLCISEDGARKREGKILDKLGKKITVEKKSTEK